MVTQYVVPSAYKELHDRSIRRMRKAVQRAIFVTVFLYAGFAIFGYQIYGSGVDSDLLNEFGWDLYGNLARFSMLISVSGSYPVIARGVLSCVEDAFFDGEFTLRQRVTTSIVTVLVSLGIGILPINLGQVNSITGALTILVVGFGAPALFSFFIL